MDSLGAALDGGGVARRDSLSENFRQAEQRLERFAQVVGDDREQQRFLPGFSVSSSSDFASASRRASASSAWKARRASANRIARARPEGVTSALSM